jgi:CYTH domain-containing protein
MATSEEFELTFLARRIPDEHLQDVELTVLEDSYLPANDKFAVLRLRQKGHSYEITKKFPHSAGDFSRHIEHTIELSEAEYRALYKVDARRLKKERYTTLFNGVKMEVDVFLEGHKGLVLIDFEFTNRKNMALFTPPDFCLMDVTQSREILGGQLAGAKIESIRVWLNEQGYVDL